MLVGDGWWMVFIEEIIIIIEGEITKKFYSLLKYLKSSLDVPE